MAERRALTARDIKSCVEGYSEMSDEAFARRFYSDRSELVALGIPLQSQRDEFTGEELYTLRSEQYFLPALELSDEELAALQTGLFLMEGKFAYAEPLRLALQNLALGRDESQPATETALAVEFEEPDYTPELAARLTKLDAAISKQRTVKFRYWSIGRDEVSERAVNPYALFSDNGVWYVVGNDLQRDAERTFRISRIRGDITFATRRERDFRFPAEFESGRYRGRPPWQVGEIVGEARIDVTGDTAWWVQRTYPARGRVEDGTFVTEYADLGLLTAWILRQNGRARPSEPAALVASVGAALERVAERHEGDPPKPAAPGPPREPDVAPDRLGGPVPPERFAVLQSLLAHLLARCGDEDRATIPAAELVERFRIPIEQLDDHLQLLNLVNFGGGCYAVYAVLDGDDVHVAKEIFGDAFRRAPRLTPLEARAISLALEFVGPMIAAEAHTTLDKVRGKLEQTFGQFERREGVESAEAGGEELIAKLAEAIERRRLVEIEYLKPDETKTTMRVIEPYKIERDLPNWYIHAWDRTRDAARSFRIDRMRVATILEETFEPRPSFDLVSHQRVARLWIDADAARFWEERGATSLEDGAALGELPFGTESYLVSEILAQRGSAVLLEPVELRKRIAKRARQLQRQIARVQSKRS
jgi:predicted DNA-binding transcriptional regulator YafY